MIVARGMMKQSIVSGLVWREKRAKRPRERKSVRRESRGLARATRLRSLSARPWRARVVAWTRLLSHNSASDLSRQGARRALPLSIGFLARRMSTFGRAAAGTRNARRAELRSGVSNSSRVRLDAPLRPRRTVRACMRARARVSLVRVCVYVCVYVRARVHKIAGRKRETEGPVNSPPFLSADVHSWSARGDATRALRAPPDSDRARRRRRMEVRRRRRRRLSKEIRDACVWDARATCTVLCCDCVRGFEVIFVTV